MERYRSLIVIASIAFFVALVLGVGLFLLYPRSGESDLLAAGRGGAEEEFDPIEYLRTPDADAPDFTPPVEEEEEPVIIIYGDEDEPSTEDAPRTPGDESTGDAEAVSTTDEPQKRPADTPSAVAPDTVAEPAAPRPTPARAVRSAPAVSEPRRQRVTEYWIQVISSPSRDTVEQAKRRLEEERLSGRVTSKTVDGREYYRLRVGPYTDKSEASKFLDWIREINDFSGSYISEEYPLRVVE